MADTAPKDITESSTCFDDQWRKLKRSKDYRAWANDRASSKTVRARNALFETLVKYCRAHGSHVVSVPGEKTVRIETARGSDLATKLTELGWTPVPCGASSRVTGAGLVEVDVIELGK